MQDNYYSATVPNDPQKWRTNRRISRIEINVLRCLIECDTQEDAAKKCLMSKRKFEDMLYTLRLLYGVTTNIQLVYKINADFRIANEAA